MPVNHKSIPANYVPPPTTRRRAPTMSPKDRRSSGCILLNNYHVFSYAVAMVLRPPPLETARLAPRALATVDIGACACHFGTRRLRMPPLQTGRPVAKIFMSVKFSAPADATVRH